MIACQTVSPSAEGDHAHGEEEQVRVRAHPEEGEVAEGHRALGLGDVVEAVLLEPEDRVRVRVPSAI